jgi:hypothetical protein
MTRRELAGDLRGAVWLGLVIDSHKYSVGHFRAGWARSRKEKGKGRPFNQPSCVGVSSENKHVGAIAPIEQRAVGPKVRRLDVFDLACAAKRRRLLSSCMIHRVSADDADNRREERSCFSSHCPWSVFGHCALIVVRDRGHPVLLCSNA